MECFTYNSTHSFTINYYYQIKQSLWFQHHLQLHSLNLHIHLKAAYQMSTIIIELLHMQKLHCRWSCMNVVHSMLHIRHNSSSQQNHKDNHWIITTTWASTEVLISHHGWHSQECDSLMPPGKWSVCKLQTLNHMFLAIMKEIWTTR